MDRALHLALGIRGGGGGGASGGDSRVDVSVEIRTLRLRLNMRRLDSELSDCRKRGLMKQRAPWPEPQSSSWGLRVLMGQNSWNRVGLGPGCLAPVSESGAAVSRLSGSVQGADSGGAVEPVCGAAAGGVELTASGFFSSSFWGLGASRGPRTFRWELQNSVQMYIYS